MIFHDTSGVTIFCDNYGRWLSGRLLTPRARIKEATQSASFIVNDPAQEVSRVVGIGRRFKLHVAIPWISKLTDGRRASDIFGNEAQPIQDRGHTFLIVSHDLMSHAIGHHDLRTSKLILGGVDIPGIRAREKTEGKFDKWSLNPGSIRNGWIHRFQQNPKPIPKLCSLVHRFLNNFISPPTAGPVAFPATCSKLHSPSKSSDYWPGYWQKSWPQNFQQSFLHVRMW